MRYRLGEQLGEGATGVVYRAADGETEVAVKLLRATDPVAQKRFLTGPWPNPFYSATNASAFHPTNGILMVARLDAPSSAIAAGNWSSNFIDTVGL